MKLLLSIFVSNSWSKLSVYFHSRDCVQCFGRRPDIVFRLELRGSGSPPHRKERRFFRLLCCCLIHNVVAGKFDHKS